jgi:hypothetical protein
MNTFEKQLNEIFAKARREWPCVDTTIVYTFMADMDDPVSQKELIVHLTRVVLGQQEWWDRFMELKK